MDFWPFLLDIHVPKMYIHFLFSDKLFLPLEQQVFSTITDIGNLEERERSNNEQQFARSTHQDIDVVSVIEEENELTSPHKSSGIIVIRFP